MKRLTVAVVREFRRQEKIAVQERKRRKLRRKGKVSPIDIGKEHEKIYVEPVNDPVPPKEPVRTEPVEKPPARKEEPVKAGVGD